MDEEIMYPVCPHRNVPAAFQRFLGPDSGGMERFFPEEHARRSDGALLIVRLHAGRAVNGVVHELSAAWTTSASAVTSSTDAVVLFARWASLFFASRSLRLPV